MGARMKKPLIGITPCYNYEKKTTYIPDGYCEGVLEAGGIAVLLPFTCDDGVLSEIIQQLDGFMISGGPDVDPQCYCEACLPYNKEISPQRDYIEIFIARNALKSNKPLLGICRGMQILNVAFNGTLYQDIEQQLKEKVVLNHSQSAPNWHPIHDVLIEGGSRLFGLLGCESIRVNSFHHQAVKGVASEFKITSRSSDNVIESIESSGDTFALGVQWHPEKMWHKDPTQFKLFSGFVEECRREKSLISFK